MNDTLGGECPEVHFKSGLLDRLVEPHFRQTWTAVLRSHAAHRLQMSGCFFYYFATAQQGNVRQH